MKKRYLTTGKKALSLVMACLMLMTCWVFFAPTEAEAYAYNMGGPNNTSGHYRIARTADTGDYADYYYPKDIYLDITETLQGVGYSINATGHFGNSKQYRMLYYATAWGGTYDKPTASDDDMITAFPDYTYTATNNASVTFTAKENYNINSADNWVVNNQNPGTVNFTVSLQGTPKATGNYYFTLSNDELLVSMQKRRYSSSGSWTATHYQASYMNGSYTHTGNLGMNVYIYDKAALDTIVTKANKVKTDSGSYTSFVTAGSWATFTEKLTAAENVLKDREVTQDKVNTANAELTTALNALYFGANSANFKADLAAANAIKAESDYAIKYTQATRTALENAISNANAGTYTTGAAFTGNAVTYAASTSSNAGALANTDQSNLNTLEAALESAINAMAIQDYTIRFKDWDDTDYTSFTKPYGTSAADVSALFTWRDTPAYDDSKHYGYDPIPTIEAVTGDKDYVRTRTEGEHVYKFEGNEGDITETYHILNCNGCDSTIQEGHWSNDAGKLTPHTCTENGYITYQCGSCGLSYKVYTDENGELIDPAAHDYPNTPEDKGDGNHGYKCTKCGEYDQTRIEPHDYAQLITTKTAPTCMADGWGLYKCACGAEQERAISRLPYDDPASHKIADVTSNGDGTHSGKCTVTGCVYHSEDVPCTDENNDCLCDANCGYQFEHVYENRVVPANLVSAATCKAYAVYTKSCKCGEVDPDGATFEDEAAGYGDHNWTSDRRHVFSPATCTENAVYYYSCLVCGISSEGLTDQTWEDPETALKHAASDVLVSSDATHHGYQCVRFDECGTLVDIEECTFTTYTDNGDGTHTAYCDDSCGNTKSGDHVMSAWVSDNKEGLVAGTQSRECTICNYAENTQKCNYKQTGHSDPTCKAEGYTTYECPDCKHGYTVVHPVDPTNHSDYGTEDVTVTPATCNAVGEYKKVCKDCGADMVTGLELPIDPTNHGENTTTTTGEKEATCIVEGYTGTVVCNGCGKTITEDTNIGLDKNNHKNKETIKKQDSTCTAPGYEEYEHCKDCNTDIGYTVIQPKGHNYDYENKVAVKLDGDVHAYQCERYAECGTTGVGGNDGKGNTENCSGGTATCTALAECDICKDTWGEYADHVFSGAYKQYTVEGIEYHNQKCAACDAYGLGTGRVTDEMTECSGGNATCTNKAVCSDCNNEYGAALEHDFTPDTERVNNLENGKHNYACVRFDECGEYGTVEDGVDGTIDCLDADPEYTEETCLTDGYYTHICDTCGYTWTTEGKPATGHTFTEKITDNTDFRKSEADCENAAVYWYDCADCDVNAKDLNEEDKAKYEAIGPLTFEHGTPNGHTWVEFIDETNPEKYLATPANCTENAVYYKSCSVCKKSSKDVPEETATFKKPVSALGHDWVEKVDNEYLKDAATCDAAAVYYKSCARCNISSKDVSGQTATFNHGTKNDHVFTEKLPDSAHILSAANCKYEAVYYFDCINCTVNAKNLEGEELAKYTADGKEITYKSGAVKPDAHPKDSLETVKYLAPTCTLGGHNEYKHCNLCGNDIGKIDETVDEAYGPLGHNFKGDYVFDAEKDTHKRACLNKCGEYGESTPCTFGDWTQSKNEEGKEIHSKNCVCGNTKTELCSGGEATCLKKAVCSTCNKEYGSTLTHKYPETWTKVEGKDLHKKVCENNCGVDIVESCKGGTATCSKLAECTECKAEYGEYSDHIFKDYIKSEDASCGVNAKETAKCENCDETDTREIPDTALKHVMSDYVFTTAPTCKDEGEEMSTCTLGCGHYVTRPVPADKTAHKWSEWKEIGGNCADGIIEERECSICGAKEKRTNTDNLQHEWYNLVEVLPGCETDGYVKQECSKCGFVQTITEGYEALGHKFEGEFTFYSAATCTSAEIHSRPCARNCGKLEFKEIEGTMLEHRWIILAGSEATCTSDGYTDYYHCADCSFEKGYVTIPAKAHADNNGDGKCDECHGVMYGDGESNKSCGCICHKENAFMRFIYKIVRFFWKLFKIGKSCDCGFEHY